MANFHVFGGGWDGPQFVLTHRPPATPVPGVTFVADIHTAITQSGAPTSPPNAWLPVCWIRSS